MTSQIAAMQQAEAEAGLKSPGLGTGNARLQAKYPQSHQGVSADAIASQEGISREALDAFGAESQRRAAHAIQNGSFDRSIVPVLEQVGTLVLTNDEHPRAATTEANRDREER